MLRALDRALHGLGRRTLATVVLAELTTQQDGSGGLFQWSNAGHPPPLLIYGDGVVRRLEHQPDLLLGVDPAAPRADHRSTLGPGDTVVLFTDGLVEHRGRSIDEGMHAVRSAAIAAADRSVEELCDALLGCLDDDRTDDVALLVVHIRAAPVHVGAGRSMR